MRSLKIILCLLTLPLFAMGQTADTSKLTGTVYDVQGSVVVGAKVTAVGSSGKKYETVSNGDGVYVLSLPFNKYRPIGKTFKATRYDITVQQPGFRVSETKAFVFIRSYFGQLYLDIALEVGESGSHM